MQTVSLQRGCGIGYWEGKNLAPSDVAQDDCLFQLSTSWLKTFGQGGTTIEQIQQSSGARVQLSRNGEFYPGMLCHSSFNKRLYHLLNNIWQDLALQERVAMVVDDSGFGLLLAGSSERVLLLSGSLHAVLTAIFLMLEKLPRDNGYEAKGRLRGDQVKPTLLASHDYTLVTNLAHLRDGELIDVFLRALSQVKMAVSRKLCGAVIGKKGQTIRDFMNDSGATIRVQPLSDLVASDIERLVTISGGRDKVLRAVALTLNMVKQWTRDTTYWIYSIFRSWFVRALDPTLALVIRSFGSWSVRLYVF